MTSSTGRPDVDQVPTYAVVSPVRDQAATLLRFYESLLNQTIAPTAWVIVDQGSRDGTTEMARQLCERHDWIDRVVVEPLDSTRSSSASMLPFRLGLDRLRSAVDVVVKQDADVSLPTDYFEQIVTTFHDEPRLGIAGGTCAAPPSANGMGVQPNHVRGTSRCYRKACLDDIWPLDERRGWDGIDELKALVAGWTAAVLPGVSFHRNRPIVELKTGSRIRWDRQGAAAHYMGYRLSYLVARSLHHAVRHPAALAMMIGYCRAALYGEPRCDDEDVRRYIRNQQRLSQLLRRALDACRRRI